DQHHGLERVDVVDALLLALCRDLGLVRPVVQLHLGDASDLAHLTEIELELVEMLGQIDRLEEVDCPVVRHSALFHDSDPSIATYNPHEPACEGVAPRNRQFGRRIDADSYSPGPASPDGGSSSDSATGARAETCSS